MSEELVGFEDVITRLQDGLSGSSLQTENFAIPRFGSNGGVFEIHMVCCSVLQCVAVCCSVLQCVTEPYNSEMKTEGSRLRDPLCTCIQCVAV